MSTEISGVRIPPLSHRIVRGALWFVPMLLIFVVIPLVGESYLTKFGVVTSLPFASLSVLGVLISLAAAARTVYRPTRAFGPLAMVSALLGIVYLLLVLPHAAASKAFGSLNITIGYAAVVLLAAVVPLVGLLSGILTTVGDARHPNERLRLDYPDKAGA